MNKIFLETKISIEGSLNLKNLSQINNPDFSRDEFKKIKVLYKNKQKNLNEIFKIKIIKSKKNFNEIFIEKTNSYFEYIGYKWTNDSIYINSDIGSYVAAKMESGKIIVSGSVENFAGAEMKGGYLQVKNNAGKFLASSLPGKKIGMTGGRIFILGNVTDYLCYEMRRGLVFVSGKSGDYSCNNLISGTVIIGEVSGRNFANYVKRGTIIVLSRIKLESHFTETSNCSNSFLKLLENHIQSILKKRIFKPSYIFLRRLGDIRVEGKGEIFSLDF